MNNKDFSQRTDAELHDRLQAIHDEIRRMEPVTARTDRPIEPNWTQEDIERWQVERPRLQAERERIRAELGRRGEEVR